MAVARVVTFDGVDGERMKRLSQEIQGGEGPPGDVPAKEIIVLHDPDGQRSMVVLFFDSEDDYTRGDSALNAMASDDTPGSRTSVSKYAVAARMSS